MTNEQIKQIFLANGFTEKPQAGGHTDLNPYVYDAARALIEADRENSKPTFTNREEIRQAVVTMSKAVYLYYRSLPDGIEKDEAYSVYKALGFLRFSTVAKEFIEAINPRTSVKDDIIKITNLLAENEWAEHIANTPLGQRLEGQITDMINRFNGSSDE
ncbi:hypothetical protein [Rosenbergiella metrosideri]|uniref:hypothetical protein n=1 Tax=Rosenbergiella metrosideri TaxID=2921185 RepID=UPI001F4F977E|nr:hypothetical protein [Rosenbergiella metrosideri]